jgi:hypothetical protein
MNRYSVLIWRIGRVSGELCDISEWLFPSVHLLVYIVSFCKIVSKLLLPKTVAASELIATACNLSAWWKGTSVMIVYRVLWWTASSRLARVSGSMKSKFDYWAGLHWLIASCCHDPVFDCVPPPIRARLFQLTLLNATRRTLIRTLYAREQL